MEKDIISFYDGYATNSYGSEYEHYVTLRQDLDFTFFNAIDNKCINYKTGKGQLAREIFSGEIECLMQDGLDVDEVEQLLIKFVQNEGELAFKYLHLVENKIFSVFGLKCKLNVLRLSKHYSASFMPEEISRKNVNWEYLSSGFTKEEILNDIIKLNNQNKKGLTI